MSAKLLSSLVQTKSIELVLAPIAAQVSELIILNEVSERDGIALPDLIPSGRFISEAVENLVAAGHKLLVETADEDLQSEMPVACNQLTDAKNSLLLAAHQVKQEPFSHKVRYDLVDSARNILEGTMKILIVYDEAEVRKIVRAARWVMDRVGLVEAVTSLRGLVVSFKGFTESLMLLGSLCDKRQRELSNPSLRDRLLSSMTILKKSIKMLSTSMQTCLKAPGNPQAKASRDYIVGQVMLACTEIIKTVQSREGSEGGLAKSGLMAETIDKAQHQLSPHSRLGSSNELDCCLDAIVRSSMAVAEISDGLRREKIVQQCQKVLQTRNELGESQKAVTVNPLSSRTKRRLDRTAEKLSTELKKLDRLVTAAVVDQISSVFADAELPVHNLLTAATAPLLENSVTALEEAAKEFNDKAEEFKKESANLVQVSRHAAALSADRRRVSTINSIVAEIEQLSPKLLSTALAVRRTPHAAGAVQRLGVLRKQWSAKIEAVTDVIDDVTDVTHFVDATERQVREDIARCREALTEQDVKKLSQTSLRLLGRARRLIHVTKKEMKATADPRYKGKLQSASGQLVIALPSLARSAEDVLTNMWDVTRHEQFTEHARLIGEKVKVIKSAVKRPTEAALDFVGTDAELSETSSFAQSENLDDLLAAHGLDDTGSDDLSVGESGSLLDDMGSVSITSSLSDQEFPGLHENRKSPDESQIKPTLPPREIRRERPHGSRISGDLLDSVLGDDEELELIDRKALLGLGRLSESPLSGRTTHVSRPSRTSRAPVSRLVRAARGRDSHEIEARVRDILSKTDTLKGLADGSAEKSRNMEGVRLVLVTAGEIEKLSPLIVEAARNVSADPRNEVAVERLHAIGREWASKVHVLSTAVDELVMPWSAAASKLALAATSGDAEELKRQVDNINRHVTRLRQLASSTKAAADAEDYAMDAGSEGEAPARDPASLQRIELVRVTSEEIEQITPDLTSSARAVVRNPSDIMNVERLEQLRRDWASKVHSLVFAVDDVTVGTSAPVEQLASAAMAGDHHALQERSRMLALYARMLKEMASAATAGCRNPKKVSVAESTVTDVERLTADLQDTARVVTDMALRGNTTVGQSLSYMGTVERMGLLQREWAAKAHLLTALVDDLTADASAPVDRLAGAALAVSKAELDEDRLQQERHFEVQAQELAARVARVTAHASKAVEKSRVASKVRNVRVTGDFIDRLTPQVIAAARALADNPDQPTVEHFQMLRRQWASKAQLLMATLDELPDADHSAVQNVFQDLLDGPQLEQGVSFESLNEYEVAAIAGSSRHHPPGARATDRTPSPPRTGVTDQDSKNKVHERSLSDTDELPEVRRLRGPGGSASDTDLMRKAVVDELHERFSSSESLNQSSSSARSWTDFDRHRRAFSVTALSRPDPAMRSASTEELRARKNSKSIAMAARILQDETDKWEEKNNSIVKVAKQMAQQMMQMAQFARGRGELQSKTEMINTAKAIADNGKVMWNFAQIIAEQCIDERCKRDLLYYAEYIPTISNQLKIISSVKAATPMDYSADATLVKNAENLMQAVVKTLKAAEVACVKGLRPPEQSTSADHAEAAQLAFQWKKTLKRQRAIEALTAPRGQLGLRRHENSTSSPSLVDIVHV